MGPPRKRRNSIIGAPPQTGFLTGESGCWAWGPCRMVQTSLRGIAALPVDDPDMLAGLTDLAIWHDAPGGPILYATGRAGGYLKAFDLGAEAGLARETDSWQIPAGYLQLESTDLILRPDGAATDLLLVGLADPDIRGRVLSGSGFGGNQRYDAGDDDLRNLSEVGLYTGSNMAPDVTLASVRTGGLVQLDFQTYDRLSVSAPLALGSLSTARADAVRLFEAGGTRYGVAAFGSEDALALLRMDAGGQFVLQQRLDVGAGLWIDRPGALTSLTGADGEHYVVLASSGSSSLTVLQLVDGALVPVSHLLDDRVTRFEQAAFVEAFEVAGLPFIVAAGGDNGLSVLAVMPGGRLSPVNSDAGSISLPVGGISALAVQETADGARIFVASQTQPHLIEFAFTLDNPGAARTGSAAGDTLSGTAFDDMISGLEGDDSLLGGGGADLLLDGAGSDTLRGQSGADQFILVADGAVDTVADYQRFTDRIELTSPELVPDLADVQVISRPWGAELVLEGERLLVYTLDGSSLSQSDLQGYLSVAPHVGVDPEAYPDPGPVEGPEAGGGLAPTQLPGDAPGEIESGSEPLITPNISTPRRGTPGPDTIAAFGGNDQIVADASHDLVVSGAGDDIVLGEMGFDTLEGRWGNDSLSGGGNADWLDGGADHDLLTGGDGFDQLFGQTGNDTLWGGASPDRLWGGDGDDWIHAGSNFGTSVDGVEGGRGNDTILGSAGFDLLLGNEGNDRLDGGHQADNLYGGAGDDSLVGGPGFDRLFGEDGDDQLSGGDGPDSHFGHAGDDTLWGGAGDDRFFGGSGDDIISGGQGHDTLSGNAGFDTLIGGAGNDVLRGDFNADRFVFEDHHGRDLVLGFDATSAFEVLDFSGLSAFTSTSDVFAAMRQEGRDVVIVTSASSSIRLIATDIEDIDGTDFLF